VTRYGRLLRAIAFRMRMRSCDVEDAMQTTWLALSENIDSIHDPERVGAWLSCVMRRRCLQILVGQRRERLDDRADEWAAPDGPTAHGTPSEPVIWSFVDRLPARERILLRTLFDGTDHTYREVAHRLSMPVGAIGPVRMRAVRRLAALLAEAGVTVGDLLPTAG